MGKIMGQFWENVVFFLTFSRVFFLKMGELFAHFEKKWENIGKNTKKIRNFLAIFPSVRFFQYGYRFVSRCNNAS